MLFRRYYVVVMRFIWKMLKDRHAAEDIAQNIFLKIWQGRHCLDSKRSIKGLLFSMSKNEAINVLKAQRLNVVSMDNAPVEHIGGGGFHR